MYGRSRAAVVRLQPAGRDVNSNWVQSDGASWLPYKREVESYRQLAQDIPIETPACLAAEITDDDQGLTLPLESVSSARRPDVRAGCTADEASRIRCIDQ